MIYVPILKTEQNCETRRQSQVYYNNKLKIEIKIGVSLRIFLDYISNVIQKKRMYLSDR